jgi:hypothetical protein
MVWDGEHERAVVLVGLKLALTDGSVVEASIGDLPLTLGGEVDCVTSEPVSLDKTVELKTNMVIQNARHDATFHK